MHTDLSFVAQEEEGVVEGHDDIDAERDSDEEDQEKAGEPVDVRSPPADLAGTIPSFYFFFFFYTHSCAHVLEQRESTESAHEDDNTAVDPIPDWTEYVRQVFQATYSEETLEIRWESWLLRAKGIFFDLH